MTLFASFIRARALHRRTLACAFAILALVGIAVSPAWAQAGPKTRDELVQKLTGKKIRVNKATGAPRAISADEAKELVTSLEAMTARAAVVSTTVSPTGAKMATLDGHTGHIIVARPNADGTTSLRCVATVEEAVDFLSEESPDVM